MPVHQTFFSLFSDRSMKNSAFGRCAPEEPIDQTFFSLCSDHSTKIVYASRIPPRQPRTLRTWLRSPRNFGKTLFEFFFGFFFVFSSFSADFGGARLFWMSKSSSWGHFAADGRVLRPVRCLEEATTPSSPKKVERAGPSYARFLVFLEAWILTSVKV